MSSIERSLLVSLLILLISQMMVCPVNCTDETNQTGVLIDGVGYVLASGETRGFYQGYTLVIKDVDAKGEKAWINLIQNGTSVRYGTFKSKDSIIYSKNGEIFNITSDQIYVGSKKDLVFFYVYQHLDPDLPEPLPLSDGSPELNVSSPDAISTVPPSLCDAGTTPGCGLIIAICMVLIAYITITKPPGSG